MFVAPDGETHWAWKRPLDMLNQFDPAAQDEDDGETLGETVWLKPSGDRRPDLDITPRSMTAFEFLALAERTRREPNVSQLREESTDNAAARYEIESPERESDA